MLKKKQYSCTKPGIFQFLFTRWTIEIGFLKMAWDFLFVAKPRSDKGPLIHKF